jgi:hypothetical protein
LDDLQKNEQLYMKNLTLLLILILFSAFFPEKAIAMTSSQERWVQPSKKQDNIFNPYVLFNAEPINVINPTTHPLFIIALKAKLTNMSALESFGETVFKFAKEGKKFVEESFYDPINLNIGVFNFEVTNPYKIDFKTSTFTSLNLVDIKFKQTEVNIFNYDIALYKTEGISFNKLERRAKEFWNRASNPVTGMSFSRNAKDMERYDDGECFHEVELWSYVNAIVKINKEIQPGSTPLYADEVIREAVCGGDYGVITTEEGRLNRFMDDITHVMLGDYQNGIIVGGMHSFVGFKNLIKTKCPNNTFEEVLTDTDIFTHISSELNFTEGLINVERNDPIQTICGELKYFSSKILEDGDKTTIQFSNDWGNRKFRNGSTVINGKTIKAIKTILISWDLKEMIEAMREVIRKDENPEEKTDHNGESFKVYEESYGGFKFKVYKFESGKINWFAMFN